MVGRPSGGIFLVLLSSLAVGVLAEEEASPVAIAIAATLLGSISFVMSLYYLVNFPDKDMRRYTYEVLSSTISIFCAVLLFQAVNDLLETYLLDGTSVEFQLLIDGCHMVFWFFMLQLCLAWFSGAIGAKPTSTKDVKMNVGCFGVLLAHMTGFAAINFWASVQQLDFFASSPCMAFLAIPPAAVCLRGLMSMTDIFREKLALGDDGKKDKYEDLWDEATAEAENDVMGLAISFLAVQAVRYAISGILANQEGEEEPKDAASHSSGQVIMLFLAAMGFVALTVTALVKTPDEERITEEEERNYGQVTTICSMGMAWSIFFTVRWKLGSYPVFAADPTLHGVCNAMFTSFCSFATMFVLDKIADADWTGEKADEVIRHIIGAIGILVGFAWEQCFDLSVNALSSVAFDPHLVKLVLALLSCFLIIPAWRSYMLPMVVKKGWKLGYIVTPERITLAQQHLKEEEQEEEREAQEWREKKERMGRRGSEDDEKGKLKEALLPTAKGEHDSLLITEAKLSYINTKLDPLIQEFVDRCLRKMPDDPRKELKEFAATLP